LSGEPRGEGTLLDDRLGDPIGVRADFPDYGRRPDDRNEVRANDICPMNLGVRAYR
jgi:hypothetical protein